MRYSNARIEENRYTYNLYCPYDLVVTCNEHAIKDISHFCTTSTKQMTVTRNQKFTLTVKLAS